MDCGLDMESVYLRWELRQNEALAAKLMKLNQAELLVLARHYKLSRPEDYREGWQRNGKLTLVSELAAIMIDMGYSL